MAFWEPTEQNRIAMRRLVLMTALLAALGMVFVLLGGTAAPASPTTSAAVLSVHDGDTLTLADGRRVRLLQIDTPELGGECYSRAARTALLRLAPVGSRIELEIDPRLDRVDRYGRLLRYVHRGRTNVNVELVREGAAAPYFYDGARGRYASTLLAAAQSAKSAKRGLWKACASTLLDPTHAVATGSGSGSGHPAAAPASGARCDPNYAGGCVPPYPPDVDCADIRALGIAPVRVIGSDPHRLDGDGDGWGCE
jgi:micrococcal nuclease